MNRNFTANEYLTQREGRRLGDPQFYETPWYLEHIPLAPIALCPYCGIEFIARFDFNSMAYWDCQREFRSAGLPGLKTRGNFTLESPFHGCCEHLFLYDTVVNFRGNEPQTDYVRGVHYSGSALFASEVPGVIPVFMNTKKGLFSLEDVYTEEPSHTAVINVNQRRWAYSDPIKQSTEKIDIKAVMSTFPVCQIRDGDFVECCDSYFISYFTPEPNDSLTEGREYKWNRPEAVYHVLNVVADLYDREGRGQHLHALDFDLQPYLDRGDLYWMAEGKLHGAQEKDQFPFGNITGRKTPFTALHKKRADL